MAVPFLVLGVGGIGRSNGEACTAPAALDVPPTILGRATLAAGELATWWGTLGRGQPAGLRASVAEIADLYIDEGEAEGVRGDWAFAQAVHETGFFTSQDTTLNNFAGIAHRDGAAAGSSFPDPATGVRAHIQLLKKFAAGNDVELATPDIAPRAGAAATTWADLAGTWATDSDYWASISSLYREIGAHGLSAAGTGPDPDSCEGVDGDAPEPATDQPSGPVELATVRGIRVDSSIAPQLERLLAAAEADGLILNGHGYRSHDEQIALREAHCGSGHYNVFEKPASRCSPPTARPGFSQHELGLAIDFVSCSTHSTRCWQWLDANAATAVPDFALFNLASEPWHWSTSGN